SLISWQSKRQTFVATSSMESEYAAAANAGREAIWISSLVSEISCRIENKAPPKKAPCVTIFSDSQSAIKVSRNPEDHPKTKHIAISYHFLRDKISKGIVRLEYVSTKLMDADFLTKPLERVIL